MSTRMAEMERKTERKIAGHRAPPDAADYFAGGKQHEAFMGWIKTQPEERQQVLMNSWDSNDIIPALNDFKRTPSTRPREAAAKGNRIARSVGAGTSSPAAKPRLIADSTPSRPAGTKPAESLCRVRCLRAGTEPTPEQGPTSTT